MHRNVKKIGDRSNIQPIIDQPQSFFSSQTAVSKLVRLDKISRLGQAGVTSLRRLSRSEFRQALKRRGSSVTTFVRKRRRRGSESRTLNRKTRDRSRVF